MADTAHKHHAKSDVRYGHVDSKADLDRIFGDIREDISHIKTRAGLTELYRRAGYLITLSYSAAWEKKFGDKTAGIRHEAEADFRKTAKLINAHAKKIGTADDFDEAWGKMKD